MENRKKNGSLNVKAQLMEHPHRKYWVRVHETENKHDPKEYMHTHTHTTKYLSCTSKISTIL